MSPYDLYTLGDEILIECHMIGIGNLYRTLVRVRQPRENVTARDTRRFMPRERKFPVLEVCILTRDGIERWARFEPKLELRKGRWIIDRYATKVEGFVVVQRLYEATFGVPR